MVSLDAHLSAFFAKYGSDWYCDEDEEEVEDCGPWTALHEAAGGSDVLEVRRHLRHAWSRGEEGDLPLHVAATETNSVEVLLLLVEEA